MYGFKNLSVLATLGAMLAISAAAPASVEGGVLDTKVVDRAPEDNVAIVTVYAGDGCGGQNDQYVITSGGSRCIPVPFAVRSIQLSGGGCSVTTVSGTDCGGSSFGVPYNTCSSVLYGSVLVNC